MKKMMTGFMMVLAFLMVTGCTSMELTSSQDIATASDSSLCMDYSARHTPAVLAEMERRGLDSTGTSMFRSLDPGAFVAMSNYQAYVGEEQMAVLCTYGYMTDQQTTTDDNGPTTIDTFKVEGGIWNSTYITIYFQNYKVVLLQKYDLPTSGAD